MSLMRAFIRAGFRLQVRHSLRRWHIRQSRHGQDTRSRGILEMRMKMLILIGFIAVSCTSAPNKKCIVQKNQVRVVKTEKSTAFKYLQGIWIIPHAADIRIVFKNDSTFEFHDYNSIKDSIEILKGIYVLNNDQLTLRYTDRPQQKFIYHFGRYEDERYIRKGKYYFVKQ